jgi:hypothetical protein
VGAQPDRAQVGLYPITRPDGSNEGIAALESSQIVNGDPCIDFARSSRKPLPTDSSAIAFVAMAGDAIDYSSPEASGFTSPVPDGMTLADLVNIYNCTWTNWDQVPGNSANNANNAPIVPVLPQSGSGIRTEFLLTLGGGTTPLTPGSCVVNGTDASDNPIEGYTGVGTGNANEFGTTTAPNVDAVFPYSVGDYIAQGPAANGVGGHANNSIWARGPLVLHDMTTDGGTLEAPTTTNSSGQVVINQNFEPQLQHVLYNVVHNGGTAAAPAFPSSPSYEANALPAIFGPHGWICKNATAQADLVSYGFFSLGANCGSITDEFLTYGS